MRVATFCSGLLALLPTFSLLAAGPAVDTDSPSLLPPPSFSGLPYTWSLEVDYRPLPLALQETLWHPCCAEDGIQMSVRGALRFSDNWKGFIQVGSNIYPLNDQVRNGAYNDGNFVGGGVRYTFDSGMYIEGAVNVNKTEPQATQDIAPLQELLPMMSVGYHF